MRAWQSQKGVQLKKRMYLARVDNLDGLVGAVVRRGGVSLDLLNEVHALENLAEHDVLAVKPGSVDGGQEELRAVGVLAGVGHRESAGEVLGAVKRPKQDRCTLSLKFSSAKRSP